MIWLFFDMVDLGHLADSDDIGYLRKMGQNSWPMTYVFLITSRPSILPQSNISDLGELDNLRDMGDTGDLGDLFHMGDLEYFKYLSDIGDKTFGQ